MVADWPASVPASTPSAPKDEAPALREAFPASAAEAEAADAPAIAIIERQVDPLPAGSADARLAIADDAMAADAPSDVTSAPVASGSSPSPFVDDDFILEIPPLAAAEAAPAPAPAATLAQPASADDGTAWAALAEELRMQVLQRLDLFTDTGLREQLGARLSPIVERASTQMIETINRELGELVRAYVAEAIEREIETWRSRDG